MRISGMGPSSEAVLGSDGVEVVFSVEDSVETLAVESAADSDFAFSVFSAFSDLVSSLDEVEKVEVWR